MFERIRTIALVIGLALLVVINVLPAVRHIHAMLGGQP